MFLSTAPPGHHVGRFPYSNETQEREKEYGNKLINLCESISLIK